MTITLDLPEELESELSAQAARLGLSLQEYVLRVLAAGSAIGKNPNTGAELIQYWQSEGSIGSRAEIVDSQSRARHIREQAEHRTRT